MLKNQGRPMKKIHTDLLGETQKDGLYKMSKSRLANKRGLNVKLKHKTSGKKLFHSLWKWVTHYLTGTLKVLLRICRHTRQKIIDYPIR
jgi:hypothetical protein